MRGLAWTILCFMCAGGCSGPSLDLPEQAPLWSLEVEPGASRETVPPLFRARVRGAPRTGQPWLFRGELSDYYERAVRRAELSGTLRERAVPLRYWRDGGDCWLQPLAFLEPNETYSLAFEGVGSLRALRADPVSASPVRRLFPPLGRPKYRVVVLCGVPAPSDTLVLAPDAVPLRAASGMAGAPLPDCWTLSTGRELSVSAVSPPELATSWRDAAPWLPAAPGEPPGCEWGVSVNGACVEAWDDRIFITPQVEDQLWLLAAAGQEPVSARVGTRTRLLRGLAAESSLLLTGSVLSSGQGLVSLTLPLVTAPARPHLVLNEVLANPLGAEMTSEWVELLNDGEAAVNLAGFWLEDSGGHAALPAVELRPGEVALLVGPGFRASGQDVAVPEGVRMLQLAHLGTRGLANGGEALALVGTQGIVSRFPLLPAAHPGRSWARREPDGADDDPSAFSEHGGVGASPGAANTFDEGAP